MARVARFGLILSLTAGLAACSSPWTDAPRVEVDGYTIRLLTDPSPLRVGSSAQVTARIEKNDQPVEGCHVAFRQSMHGMEMDSDAIETVMTEGGGGQYTGAARDFGMGGDWLIAVTFECNAASHTAPFNFALKWPE
jgi:hypothetical protein